MKTKSTLILSLLLAATILSGLFLYGKYRNIRNEASVKQKDLISLEKKISQLNKDSDALKDHSRRAKEENLKQLDTARTRISELEEVADADQKRINALNENIRILENTHKKEKNKFEHQMMELKSTYDDLVSNSTQKIQDQGIELSMYKEKYEDAASQTPILNEKIETCRQDLIEHKEQVNSMKTQLEEIQSANRTAISRLESELKQRNAEITDFREKNEHLTAQRMDQDERYKECMNNTERLQGQLSERVKEKDELDAEMEELRLFHNALFSEIAQETKKLSGTIAQVSEQYKDLLSPIPLLDDIANELNEMKTIRFKLAELKKQRDEAKTLLDKLKSNHELIIYYLREEIQLRDNAVTALVKQLQDEISDVFELNKKLEKHQTDLDVLHGKYSTLEKEKNSIDSLYGELKSTHTGMVLALKDDIVNRDTQISELQKEILLLQKRHDTAVWHLDELKSTHTNTIPALKADIVNRDNQIAELQKEISVLEKRHDTAVLHLDELKSTHTDTILALKADITNRDTQIAELQKEISLLQKRHDATVLHLDELKSTHEASIDKYQMEIQNRNSKIDDLNHQIIEVKRQASALYQDAGNRKQQINEFKYKLTNLLGQQAQLVTQMEEMKTINNTMISDLKGQIRNKDVTIQELEEKLSITFVDRILFESGKAHITAEGKALLEKVGGALKKIRAKRIRVVGHTDDRLIHPENRYVFPSNWELSSARAAAVVRYFQKQIGIDPQNMEAVGQSFYQPVATNETEDGRRQNRRVAIIISPKLD